MSNESNPIAAIVAQLRDEHVFLTIEGAPYEVVAMSGREGVSSLFSFELIIEDRGTGTPPASLLGKSMEMTLHDGFGLRRSIQGVVAKAHRTVRDEGTAELTVTLRPNCYPLSVSRDSRVFQDMTVQQIVDKVLLKNPVPYRWDLVRGYRERVYTAQYREEDWTFISRLLEEEGIYYWFDHEGADTVLVFSDDSPHASRIPGEAPIEFITDTGMNAPKELIHELAAEAHASATKFTVGSFNPWNPDLKVMATEGDGIHEMYDAPGGGPEDPAVCRHQAKNRLECAHSHRYTVSGNSTSVRIVPGRLMDVFGHPIHDGTYFITEVTYQVTQRRRFSKETGGYECHFECVDAAKPYRHPEVTPVNKQAGIQTGRVVGPPSEEIHTDDRGRVRVQLHWDREGKWDDTAGKWMRVAQRGVASSMMYPRIGWNVTTFMEEGAVDAPSVLARLHDAEHPPTYALPDNKTRTVFRTLTSPGGGSANEIRFEDLAGIQEFFMNASRNMSYDVNNDMAYSVGRNNEQKVGGNHDLEVGDSFVKDVKADQTCEVQGDEELEIAEDRDKGVAGDETEKITGDRKIKVGSNMAYTCELDRELKVTGEVKETAKDGLFKFSGQTGIYDITGSCTHTMEGKRAGQIVKTANLTVNAAKTETAGLDWGVNVNNCLNVKIGTDLVMGSQEHFTDSANRTSTWRIKGQVNGLTRKVMMVEAKDEIILKSGGTLVKITPTDISITSGSLDLGNSSVLDASAGSKIFQN